MKANTLGGTRLLIGVVICSRCGVYEAGEWGLFQDGKYYCYDCEPFEARIKKDKKNKKR